MAPFECLKTYLISHTVSVLVKSEFPLAPHVSVDHLLLWQQEKTILLDNCLCLNSANHLSEYVYYEYVYYELNGQLQCV